MKLARFSDSINYMPPYIRECLIREAPHTRLHKSTQLPKSLEFLRGTFLDLGFENLGLSPDDFRSIMLAYVGDGVLIPGSEFIMRYTQSGTVLETMNPDHKYVTLPENWSQGVLVWMNDEPGWIGKRVRPEQYGNVDLGSYIESSDGYLLRT